MNVKKIAAIALVPAALALAAVGVAAPIANADVWTGPESQEGTPGAGPYYSVELTGEPTWDILEHDSLIVVPAKVCVLRDNPTSVNGWSRISVQPWQIPMESNDGKPLRAWDRIDWEVVGDHEAFRYEGSYRVGDCVQGKIPFLMEHASTHKSKVVWDSGLGQVEEFELPPA